VKGWQADAFNGDFFTTYGFTVYAICANVCSRLVRPWKQEPGCTAGVVTPTFPVVLWQLPHLCDPVAGRG
jgi:hypothetical protein